MEGERRDVAKERKIGRKLFDVSSKKQLAKLLAVAPGEIDHLISCVGRYYRRQKLSKEDGSIRSLSVPRGKLKLLQRKIKQHILAKFPYLPCVQGGARHRSIVTNAARHVAKDVVFCVDIKDFFPHVGPERVLRIFDALGFTGEPARILTRLTTWNYQLPQGAPTSTSLANLSLIRVDVRLEQLAKKHQFSYTRYVDNFTLSGTRRLL